MAGKVHFKSVFSFPVSLFFLTSKTNKQYNNEGFVANTVPLGPKMLDVSRQPVQRPTSIFSDFWKMGSQQTEFSNRLN